MKFLNLLLIALLLTACAKKLPGTKDNYPLDGVKLLTPAITDGSDPSTMLQNTYAISTSRRLLLRLEDFTNLAGIISTLTLKINLASAADLAQAQSSFLVCPVVKNWMMLATWTSAYPMGPSGLWNNAGGDYDASACVSAGTASGTSLSFDVTPWYTNYLKGRNTNYGLILISSLATSLVIQGDTSSYTAPTFEWVY